MTTGSREGTTKTWREEIEEGVIPKNVPRDEWDDAADLIATRALVCQGCAAKDPEVNGKKYGRPAGGAAGDRGTAKLDPPTRPGSTGSHATDGSCGFYLHELRLSVVTGTCELDESDDCVELTKCKTKMRLVFKWSGGPPPSLDIGTPFGNASSVLPQNGRTETYTLPLGGTGTVRHADYIIDVEKEVDCGGNFEDTYDGSDFPPTADGYTFAANTHKLKVKFGCEICEGTGEGSEE